jgi:hypothetical protein
MMGKRLFLALAAGALLLLQFADCMSSMTPDQQSMQCCASMPCNPANQSHDCCKTMVSSHAASILPTAHISLSAPAAVVTDYLQAHEIIGFAAVLRPQSEAPQHSPPDLYTLHASLLI